MSSLNQSSWRWCCITINNEHVLIKWIRLSLYQNYLISCHLFPLLDQECSSCLEMLLAAKAQHLVWKGCKDNYWIFLKTLIISPKSKTYLQPQCSYICINTSLAGIWLLHWLNIQYQKLYTSDGKPQEYLFKGDSFLTLSLPMGLHLTSKIVWH